MFDILFGWRKASKCKNLVRRVQCRLKLLKIKRHSIVRQLRDDIAQLLNSGHTETAFSRVEQLFKDQSLLVAYDLLDHFCEFIIVHFPYIRKHKDSPNDINEAVSTLIFAAAWCGDLPELKMIQKLFGERYGHKFAKAAIELHPGTLVNNQFREKLCIKSIPDDAIVKLIDEIAQEYSLHQRLLCCDNVLKLKLPKLHEASDCQLEGFIFKGEAEDNYNSLSAKRILASCNEEELTERSFNSNPAIQILESLQATTMHRCAAKMGNFNQFEIFYQPEMNTGLLCGQSILESCSSNMHSAVSLENMVEMTSTVPQEISFQFHKSIVNFEVVQEFQFSTAQDQYDEDKRIFLFNPSIFPLGECSSGGACFLFLSNHSCSEHEIDRLGSCNRMAWLGNSNFNSNGKRLKRIGSKESQIYQCMSPVLDVKDTECEQYYGEFFNFSQNQEFICHQCGLRDKHWRKMPLQAGRSSTFACNEKLVSSQQLHYSRMSQEHIYCDIMQGHIPSSKCKFNQDMEFNCSLEHPCYYSVVEFHNDILIKKYKKFGEAEVSDFSANKLKGSNEHIELETGTCACYARTVTLSPEKLKDAATANNLQSASTQFQLSERSITSSPSHVHPKLPDYDELAAKFMALKKEHQKRTAAGSKGTNIIRD